MWESTPIFNKLLRAPEDSATAIMDQYIAENMAMHRAAQPPVTWHKEKLGRQKYCWTGEFRFWIWEGSGWRVYVSNQKGVCFEVQSDLTWQQALDAWKDYQRKVGLL